MAALYFNLISCTEQYYIKIQNNYDLSVFLFLHKFDLKLLHP